MGKKARTRAASRERTVFTFTGVLAQNSRNAFSAITHSSSDRCSRSAFRLDHRLPASCHLCTTQHAYGAKPCWVLRQRSYQQSARLNGTIDSNPNLAVDASNRTRT